MKHLHAKLRRRRQARDDISAAHLTRIT
jgi:hypothetical protein